MTSCWVVREEECQEIENGASKGAHSGSSLDHGLLQTPAEESIFRTKCYSCVGARAVTRKVDGSQHEGLRCRWPVHALRQGVGSRVGLLQRRRAREGQMCRQNWAA